MACENCGKPKECTREICCGCCPDRNDCPHDVPCPACTGGSKNNESSSED